MFNIKSSNWNPMKFPLDLTHGQKRKTEIEDLLSYNSVSEIKQIYIKVICSTKYNNCLNFMGDSKAWYSTKCTYSSSILGHYSLTRANPRKEKFRLLYQFFHVHSNTIESTDEGSSCDEIQTTPNVSILENTAVTPDNEIGWVLPGFETKPEILPVWGMGDGFITHKDWQAGIGTVTAHSSNRSEKCARKSKRKKIISWRGTASIIRVGLIVFFDAIFLFSLWSLRQIWWIS